MENEENIIRNEKTGEEQWVKLPPDTKFEDTPMAKAVENESTVYHVENSNSNITMSSEKIEPSSVTHINPVDKSIDEMEKQLGVKFNREKVLNISREALLDFIESENPNSDMTEEEINKMVDNMLQAVEVPAVIEQRNELQEELGLTADDLKTLYRYLSGKSSTKPAFLDRYLAGSQNKLLDFQHVITLIRLAQVPQLAAMNASIQNRLYSPENLLHMDVKDLSTASANISREISDILNNATKSIELINSMGRVDSRYQALMDKLLVVPDDVLNQVEHLLNNYQ